jgi:hypothetical protein
MADALEVTEDTLATYQEQLTQVEQMLLDDHENQELLEMYNDLQQVPQHVPASACNPSPRRPGGERLRLPRWGPHRPPCGTAASLLASECATSPVPPPRARCCR